MGYKIGYKSFIEDNLSLVNKSGDLVPFKVNKIQDKYLSLGTGKDIILKARQQGFSSLILAIFTTDFIFKRNSRSIVVADDKDNAIDLLDRVKLYLETYEEKTGIKVPLKYDSKYELYNEAMKSRYTIGTAQKAEFGRSKTISNLHLCLGEDTKVIVKNGVTKAIRDVEIGDVVVTKNGSLTKVSNKWDTGIKEIKKIELWLGNESIYVSPEHKVMVASKGYNGLSKPEWKQAKDLTTKDFVMWAYPKTGAYVKHITLKRQKNCKHLSNPIPPKTKIDNVKGNGLLLKTDYSLGYFFGYYLAEGHVTKDLNQVIFACEKDEVFYKKFISLFPIEPKVEVVHQDGSTRKEVIYYSKELGVFINDLVGRVKDKHIPDKFLYQYPKSFLQGLYDGWKDGDGSKGSPAQKNISLTTIRESIARQMRQIYALLHHQILALDYKSDVYRYDVKVQPTYILREHGNSQIKKNGAKSLVGKRQRYVIPRHTSPKNGYLYVQIKSIEGVEKQQTYELEVEDKSHSFMTVCGLVSNSEFSFYKNNADRLLAGALQAVVPGGRSIIETTANGFNFFKEYWSKSVAGDTGFKALFFPASDFYEPEFLKMKEMELGRTYLQEYPERPIDAFITSGESYFDKNALADYLKRIEKNPIPPRRELFYV